MHYEAKVVSDKNPNGRVAVLRINPDGKGQGECANCGTSLTFDPLDEEEIEAVACSTECAKEAGFYPEREAYIHPDDRPGSKNKSKTPDNCPFCNGPKCRGGYKHTDECNRPGKAYIPKPPCSECGGPRKGRGFTHEPGCSLRKAYVKLDRGPCSACGGPPFKKGWKHTDDCPNSTKNKLEAARKAREEKKLV